MKTNEFGATVVSKTSTTMYEVPDPENEILDYSDQYYCETFTDLIRSLGFEVESANKHLPTYIKINGHDFYIRIKNCSYSSKNAFTRKRSVRKPQNRFISLGEFSFGDEYFLKLQINKQIPKQSIIDNINATIIKQQDAIQRREMRENTDRENTISIGKHICVGEQFCKLIYNVTIDKGEISISIVDTGYISFNVDFVFMKFCPPTDDADNIKQLKKLLVCMSSARDKVNFILNHVASLTPLNSELKEWAKGAYRQTFDVKKMTYE